MNLRELNLSPVLLGLSLSAFPDGAEANVQPIGFDTYDGDAMGRPGEALKGALNQILAFDLGSGRTSFVKSAQISTDLRSESEGCPHVVQGVPASIHGQSCECDWAQVDLMVVGLESV